jgi:rfaE bifunctional protein nucleotidyltransferase chain/domain
MQIKNILTQGVFLEDRFIPNYDELQKVLTTVRALGMKISMTQGVYDLLHPGHTRYLNEAKSYGDILVVALDSDEYTRARKATTNERRPVVPFVERLELIANLRSVDIVTVRDLKEHKDDPYFVIKVVRPDVLVMSKSTKDITEKDYEALKEFCGEVKVLEAKAVITTTKRLRELMTDGAGGLVDHLTTAIESYFSQAGREVIFKKGNGNGEKHE